VAKNLGGWASKQLPILRGSLAYPSRGPEPFRSISLVVIKGLGLLSDFFWLSSWGHVFSWSQPVIKNLVS
jgi:hypothetical protein